MTSATSPSAQEMLTAALARMNDIELRAQERILFVRAAHEADSGNPTWAALWHALGVFVAEERDRRRDLLAALDPDNDDEIGEIVPEPDTGGVS